MAAWRYEISLLVSKNFSTLEEKFRFSTRPGGALRDDTKNGCVADYAAM